MEVYQLLIVCALTVFVVMTLCALIPVCIVAKKAKSAGGRHLSPTATRIISFCNCMAGGVFIAMCFLGLIPYARDKTLVALEYLNVKTDFPVAESIMMLGFFLIMTSEKVLLRYHGGGVKQSAGYSIDSSTSKMTKADNLQMGSTKNSPYFGAEEDECAVSLLTDVNSLEVITPDSPSVSFNPPGSKAAPNIYQNVPVSGCGSSKPESSKRNPQHSCSQHVEKVLERREDPLQLIVLYLAIGVHSLFEGMALGLQTDQMRIFHLFFAIIFHEALVSFSIGVTLARYQMSLKRGVKYAVLFTISVPIGIALGILIQQAPGVGGSVTSAILQCLSAGIFIHVTFVELVPAEFADEKDVLPKVVFHFLGFLALALITAVMGSHH